MKFLKITLFISSFIALFIAIFIKTVNYVDSNLSMEENEKQTFNTTQSSKQESITQSIDDKDTTTEINESNEKQTLNSSLEGEDLTEEPSKQNNNINKNDNFIFIGDSRTVAMSKVVDISKYEFVTFIAKSSQGFDWFSTTGLSKLENRLNTTNLIYNIVLNLGVNDLHNVSRYADLYNSLKNKYSQHNFFVASVNPGDDAKMKLNKYNANNELIEEFNTTLKSKLNEDIIFIDSFTYLQENGFETTDGLHYTEDSSIEILDYLSNQIKNI